MTIRVRLTLAFIAVILVANSILFVATERYVSTVLVGEVQTRVRLDLNAARQIYDDQVVGLRQFLRAAAVRQPAVTSLDGPMRAEFCQLLTTLRERGGLEMLTLLDPEGRVLCRAHNLGVDSDDMSANPLVARALAEHKAASGTLVIPEALLALEGREFTERAKLAAVETPGARTGGRQELRDGMVIAAAAPILSTSQPDKLIGVLYGANLLNRSTGLVDTIKERAFHKQTYRGKDIGTATIFQDDMRIATNVPTPDGGRALGTRMSSEVYDQVLVKGREWADPAFVVHDWYITAYEPIRDPNGVVIGALYVGLLEAPYLQPQNTIFVFFLVAMALTSLASLVMLFLVTKYMLRPIERIVAMSRQVMSGDLSARVAIRPPGEMGLLCRAIDDMAGAVAEREKQLRIATSKQIGQSEKLASIGRLAAGVAHEINNPLTGVLTFANLLREKPNLDDQDREDLGLIIRETTRVRDIVRGLLDFARESPVEKRVLHINAVIHRTMQLLRGQKEFAKIKITEKLDDGIPWVLGDENQLQQVFLNLALNACEAMPDGGHLTITSSANLGQVIVSVSDTGHGISPEHLNQIFDPFFTTKPAGKGTGLGLSVSYGIIRKHGATVEVESEEGCGTTFTLRFPAASDADIAAGDQEITAR